MPSLGWDLLRCLGFAPAARFTGALKIGGRTRSTPPAHLSAPVISLFGFRRHGGTLDLHD
jgi:hypothetical protein